MKSRSEIWLRALSELGAQCSVSTGRDAETLTSRVTQEGDTFFKVALPAFMKDLERSLRLEGLPLDAFRGFSRTKLSIHVVDEFGKVTRTIEGRGYPRFLGGFLGLVFCDTVSITHAELRKALKEAAHDGLPGVEHMIVPPVRNPEMGSEEEEKMANAIFAIRQLCGMFGKEKELCSDDLIDQAVQAYVKTDEELVLPFHDGRADTLFEGGRLDDVKKVLTLVFGDVLHKVDGDIYHQKLSPGHGPGATADRLQGNQKWTLPEWTDRLQRVFPYLEYAVPNHRYWKSAEADQVRFLKPSKERPVKLTAVAKTHVTPRLIAIEPTCMQYVQQAIARPVCDLIERDKTARHFTGFTEQWPNQAMAQGGSDDGSLATLDLSEASDRVANWIVEDLFADVPHFLEGIEACRSTHVKLPSGEVHRLLKYASMGSALTFPIEAMVFTAIVLEACLRADSRSLSRSSIRKYRGVVRVYGDDIIVPARLAVSVIDSLETFGLKVNRHKSFWTGGFRESCGKEYWKGYDVSIVRFRKVLPTSRRNVDEIVSTVATRNLLLKAGLEDTAALLDDVVGPILRYYPHVAETSPILGRVHPSGLYEIDGLSTDTQAPVVQGYVVKSKIPYNEIDEHYALMKCFLETIGKRNADPEHLTRSGRPRAVSIKLVKASPF